MKADWTPTGGSLAHLGDDSAKWTMKLEQLGAQSLEHVAQMFGAATVLRLALGNQAGECVFTAAKSHASRDAAAQFFAGELARLNQVGSLVLTFDAQTLTMANAVLKGVGVVGVEGLRWTVRYTFGITTITNP
ncbi:MAG: hypothetical protein C5B50_07780 [Verrucomicrobia bacterium]|nr:MAG: hypothetical protein C5B50_07780 [Verrucomicrobiota bacterium]